MYSTRPKLFDLTVNGSTAWSLPNQPGFGQLSLHLGPADPLNVPWLYMNTSHSVLQLILFALQKFLPFPFFFTSCLLVAQLKSYFLLCGLIKLHVTLLPVCSCVFFVHTAYAACKYMLLQTDAKFSNPISKSFSWKSG